MSFNVSFCNPFQKEIIELGIISKDDIIKKFEETAWNDMLRQMGATNENEIFYSPSLQIENKETKHSLEISAVGEPDNFEFYIFYKRPIKIKSFLGFREKMNEEYTTDLAGQTHQDVIKCLTALINNNLDFLSNKVRK